MALNYLNPAKLTLPAFAFIFSTAVLAQSDHCTDPWKLPVYTTCNSVSETTFNVSQNGTTQDANASCATGTAYEDSWYTFEALSSLTTIYLNGLNRLVCLAVYSGCASGQLACTMTNGSSGSLAFATVTGTTYYVQLQRRSGNISADLNGKICIISGGTYPPAAPGDNCALALSLTPGVTHCASNNKPGMFNDIGGFTPPYNLCYNAYNDGEYWYKFTANTDQALSLAMTNVSHAFSGIFVFADCPGSGGTCFSHTISGPTPMSYTHVTPGMTIGQTYYIGIINWANHWNGVANWSYSTNYCLTGTLVSALPVGYSLWQAYRLDKSVVLKWATESEQNNSKFIIQRSEDGSVWETLGTVNGQGNADYTSNYTFTDEAPLSGTGYYRLMQEDHDGTISYTSVLSVEGADPDFSIFPNPAVNSFTVRTKGEAVQEILLYDMVGKSLPVTHTFFENEAIVDCSQYDAGSYTLTILSNGKRMSKRVFIKD